jgi:hypothetical protein
VLIQDRLIARSSRSLAVMIGTGSGPRGDGKESLRGSPEGTAAAPIFAGHRSPVLPPAASKTT